MSITSVLSITKRARTAAVAVPLLAAAALGATAALSGGAANAYPSGPDDPYIVVQRSGAWGGNQIYRLDHLSAGRWMVTLTRPSNCVEVASLADSGRVGEIRAYGGVGGPSGVEVDTFDRSGTPTDMTFQMLLKC